MEKASFDRNNKPLFVSDIIERMPDADALAQDITDSVESLQRTNPAVFSSMLEHHAIIRKIDFEILEELQTKGVSFAATVSESLSQIDPDQRPLQADLAALLMDYHMAEVEADSGLEQDEYVNLAAVAQAAAAITLVRAKSHNYLSVSPIEFRQTVETAREIIEGTVDCMSSDDQALFLELFEKEVSNS